MKHRFLAILLSIACVVASFDAKAATLSYLSADKPLVLLDYPDDWETKAASELGDYANLHSPKGSTIQVRTFEGTQAGLEGAMEEGLRYAKEQFTELEIVEALNVDHNGMASQFTLMKANDANGEVRILAMLFIAVNDETLAELWFAGPQDNDKLDAFKKVLASLRRP